MKTWDDWSDFEINKAVGFIVKSIKRGKVNSYYERWCPDYCNNPADMWPIIVNNKIGLQPDPFKNGNWFAFDIDELIMHENTNPLRSAAIVFLEMNGVKP